METRRHHLKIIGAVGATCAFPFSADELYGQQEHAHGVPQTGPAVPPFAPKFFNEKEGLVVSRVADLIIPPTDTPGAVQAGVPQYIDLVVLENKQHQSVFREGIAWLDRSAQEKNGAAFIALPEQDQIALLTPLAAAVDGNAAPAENENAGIAFFRAIKKMTADGYYTSYAGLVQELGYKGNQALPTFEGCVHEH